MKRNFKVTSMVILFLMLVVISTSVLAAPSPDTYTGDTNGTNSISNLGQSLLGIVQVVGSIGAVIILVVLGIKYMMGSAEEKADYKKTMIPYLVGAVLIFAASNIATMVYNWSNTIK